jgi:hypothetical protein
VMIGIGKPDTAHTVDRQIAWKIDALAVERGPERDRGAVGFYLDDPAAAFLAAIKMPIGRQRQTVCPIGEATDRVDAAATRIVTQETAFEDCCEEDAPTGMPGIFSRVRNTQLRVVM